MDALSVLLNRLKKEAKAKKHFLGLLYVLIGRRITTSEGQAISQGMSWRELASKLKKIRWDPETVGQLGMDVRELPPRDRERFWHQVIARAQVDSPAAVESAAAIAKLLEDLGYKVVDR